MSNYNLLPNKDQRDAYINQGVPLGGFLSAVVSNDLKGAFMCADSFNRQVIGLYVEYLYWEAPSACWGSEEKYEAWLANFSGEPK
jgi:hypothetical protein